MTPTEMIAKLDALHAAGEFHGLTIWPSKGGYQISLATTASNSWRIRSAATPGAGLAEILSVDDLNHDGMPMPWPCNRTRTASEPAMIAPPDVDEPPLPELGHGDLMDFDEQDVADVERENATEEAGIFD